MDILLIFCVFFIEVVTMLYAKNQANQLILAKEAQKKACYYCPSCQQKVFLKQGTLKIPHFAHQKRGCQSFSEGETPQHLLGKQLLARLFRQIGYQVQIEAYQIDLKQRPDLLVTKQGQVYAIEYQCAPLSVTEMVKRTQGYLKKGWKCWWILGMKHLLKQKMTQQQAQFMRYHPKLGCYLTYLDSQKQMIIMFWGLQSDNFLRLRYQRKYFTDLTQLALFFTQMHQIKSVTFSKALQQKHQQQLEYLCWQAKGNIRKLQLVCYQKHCRLQDIYPQVVSQVYIEPFFCQYPFFWQIEVFLTANCTKKQALDYLQNSLFQIPFINTCQWQKKQLRSLQKYID